MFMPAHADIPVYRIDMAKPAEERYVQLAKDFAPHLGSVSPLFDEVVGSLFSKKLLAGVIKFTSRYALRKVFDKEQTKEIKSIASAAKISTHLVVSLNLFLDLLLGCTSGAALVRPKPNDQAGKDTKNRLMHFRTLEWGMDILRELLVIVEFVDTRKGGADEVIARSVTYAGFVGCLTGVRDPLQPNYLVVNKVSRKDLSVSLNFRPNHDCKTTSLRKHQLLVLLGRREAVPSILRRILLNEDIPGQKSNASNDMDPRQKGPEPNPPSIKAAAEMLVFKLSSPCYVTFCDGSEVMVILKDLYTGRTKASNLFQVQCNHDPDHETCCGPSPGKSTAEPTQALILGDEDWLDESEDRQRALEEKWLQHMAAVAKGTGAELPGQHNGVCLDADIPTELGRDHGEVPGVDEAILQQWVETYPTTNECTHFACIMDPASGTIRWIARGPEPSDNSVSD
ncbi:LOW QUALITY PROTEIN: N-acylsphingosine amidohydrolase protein [Colletotrichum tofieldiae]|nr:LOW QUALITY PROTEIN: N-acylsphingosine amidohydrolase protein [Colletotrichum tofieldiae]